MINELDTDNSGKIEFQEFVHMMGVGVGDPEEELLDSFKVFDKNGDGFITEKELRDTLKTLHEEMDPETLNNMIKEADKNGDGRVDYAEFVKIMKH